MSLAEHSTLFLEELQRNIYINAPSRFGGDSRGMQYEHNEPQILIFKQDSEHDISFLLAEKRPNIVVDESGG